MFWVYKAPECGIEILKEQMIDLYEKIINKKTVFVCGDFNIDLLNPQGLFPRITKPSRTRIAIPEGIAV